VVDQAVVYLVPVGARRFELYAEPPVDVHRAAADLGWFARLRARAMRLAIATISDHRTLWALRKVRRATLVHPSTVTAAHAAAERDRLLDRAASHHLWRAAIAAVLLLPSVLLTIIPGPNVIAYYFAGRGVGHYLSWRGARGAVRAEWECRSEPALAELGGLADLPRAARAPRVDAIAAHLRLPSLSAFFDRAAVPARS
jgi:hypothetical protein